MHNATTKQRLSALRRKLGIFTGARWVRMRRARLRAAAEAIRATPAFAMAMTRGSTPPGGWLPPSALAPEAPSSPEEPVPTSGATVSVRPVSPGMIAASPAPSATPPPEAAPPAQPVSTSMITASPPVPATPPPEETPPAQPVSTSMITASPPAPATPPPEETPPVQPVSTSMITASPPGPAARPSQPVSASVITASPPAPAPDATTSGSPGLLRRRGLVLAAVGLVVVGAAILAWMARTRAPAASAPRPSTGPVAAIPAPPARPAVPEAAQGPAAATVPAAATDHAAGGRLEVRRGDTLWDLASHHLGDPTAWPELYRANRDRIRDPDLIFPGQTLDLPGR